MKFIVDNNLAPRLAAGMKGFGEDVAHVTEVFDADVDDIQLLTRVGDEGWCLVTRDDRMRYRPAESAALRESGAGVFVMGGKHLPRCSLIQQLVRNWPRMKRLATKTPPPFAFRVPPTGAKLTRIQLGSGGRALP